MRERGGLGLLRARSLYSVQKIPYVSQLPERLFDVISTQICLEQELCACVCVASRHGSRRHEPTYVYIHSGQQQCHQSKVGTFTLAFGLLVALQPPPLARVAPYHPDEQAHENHNRDPSPPGFVCWRVRGSMRDCCQSISVLCPTDTFGTIAGICS